MILEKGKNEYLEKLLSYINEEDKTNIDYFYLESFNRKYRVMNNEEELLLLLTQDDLSYEDIQTLLNYSGYNYKHINAVLRNTWNYEENGDISRAPEFRAIANKLQQVIMNHPTTLNDNMVAFRGVDLGCFKSYGIETIEDLKLLEGKYMFDRGFVSASIKEEKCFFKKDNDLGLNYNVKIEYMVPREFRDGIYLNSFMSYTPAQEEFLINSSNLSKVSGVTINEDGTAIVSATLIPKELYDDYYKTRNLTPSEK